MIILGIETSCDETSVAVLNESREILAHTILSQITAHEQYGGVVPEIAARSHAQNLPKLIEQALAQSGVKPEALSAIAATTGPGLIGGVMVGMMAGKALALGYDIPFLGINHIEAHILTARLTHDLKFPYLCLLISGGHTQIIVAESLGHYKILATTRDDAAGECFDKSAKMLGLPFPGGMHIERMAKLCSNLEAASERFPFTIPMRGAKQIEFSFSGLKTAMRDYIQKLTNASGEILETDAIQLCASFQNIMAETLELRMHQALAVFKECYAQEFGIKKIPVVICGGVAANFAIRKKLEQIETEMGAELIAPPPLLCTDNAAMIAWAGMEYFKIGYRSPLTLKARPRWPLDDLNTRWINQDAAE